MSEMQASKIVCRYDEAPPVKRYLSEGEDLILIAEVKRLRATLSSAAVAEREPHPDDMAVDRFADAMKVKLAKKRDEGRNGWEDPDVISINDLSYLLIQHVWKGDPVDVGNLAMMIQQRGGRITIDEEARSITPPTSELEAEIARLKEARHFWKTEYLNASADAAKFANDLVKAEARLAEAMKALDGIETHARLAPVHTSQVTAGQLMSSKLTMIRDIASKAARRVREGGKVE